MCSVTPQTENGSKSLNMSTSGLKIIPQGLLIAQLLASIIQARLNRPLCLFGRMAQVDPEGLEASDG